MQARKPLGKVMMNHLEGKQVASIEEASPIDKAKDPHAVEGATDAKVDPH